jgi:glycosyltransferase involved in cell wall biosynthesis
MNDTERIAVAHHDLMAKGGAEGVAMNVLESLHDRYDVTILTLTNPDIAALNDYYNTDVDEGAIRVEQAGPLFPVLYDRSSGFHLLKNAVLSRLVKRRSDRFDLVVSTYNEITVQTPSLQYIHMPQFRRWLSDDADERGPLFGVYDRLCRMIEGFETAAIRSSHLVANSAWTASVTENAYGVRPAVVHPPVDTTGFADTPWSEREPGFVTIGRLTPYKNVLRTIEIIERLRDRGHGVHLHVVGPTLDTGYAEQVEAAAAASDFVHLEGEVSRTELVELVSSHRYGIHGTDHEHFGMVVAELAAGGTIPFVPDGGGQREIVHEREELLYGTAEEAVERIDRVLSNPDLQCDLQGELNDIEGRFGRERFKRTICEMVKEILNESQPAARVSP